MKCMFCGDTYTDEEIQELKEMCEMKKERR